MELGVLGVRWSWSPAGPAMGLILAEAYGSSVILERNEDRGA